MESQTYLNIREQRDVLSRLTVLTQHTPLREKFFYQYGQYIAGAVIVPTTLLFWRCGFRAFNLYKYNRNRLMTIVITASCPVNAMLSHEVLVSSKASDFFRIEDPWYYGVRSVLAHQVGLICSFCVPIAGTFYCAQINGIIPVPDKFYHKESRPYTFKYFRTQMKPYVRTIAVAWAISSAFMFLAGLAEYHQSKALLAKIDRKTLSSKEN